MKKKLIITLCVSGILIISGLGVFNFFQKAPQTVDNDLGRYFIDVPVTGWTDCDGPCIMLEIENKKISALLDLGFTGLFSFNSDFISKIEDKAYVRTIKRYGYNGKEFQKRTFKIPEVIINQAYVSDVTVHETAEGFHENAQIYSESGEFLPREHGSVGWHVFEIFNLFLDLGNEKIAMSDSAETLKDHGYDIESFTQTPLISDRGFVEIDVQTSDGIMRCVLDTGSTYNLFHTKFEEGQQFDIQNTKELPKFQIGNKDFGTVKFNCIQFDMPIHVEAMLGMSFFKENMVFLDFKNQVAYFAPTIKKTDQPVDQT